MTPKTLKISIKILNVLFFQALLQLLEKETVLRCREKDLHLVEKLLPECIDSLKHQWGDVTKVRFSLKVL